MKKLFLTVMLTLLIFKNLYSQEEMWKCEKNLGNNVFSMVPVWISPNERKLIFLDKIRYANGEVDQSIYDYHEFNITNESNNSIFFSGKWSSSSKINGSLNRNSKELNFIIDKLGKRNYYYCESLEISR
jgi:hypothetical protein